MLCDFRQFNKANYLYLNIENVGLQPGSLVKNVFKAVNNHNYRHVKLFSAWKIILNLTIEQGLFRRVLYFKKTLVDTFGQNYMSQLR